MTVFSGPSSTSPNAAPILLRLAAMQNKKYAFEPDGLKDLREDAHRIFLKFHKKKEQP